MTTIRERINDAIDAQSSKGISKYGVPLEVGYPPTGCWKMEVIQELIDACAYLARLNQDLEADNKVLRDYVGTDAYKREIRYAHYDKLD